MSDFADALGADVVIDLGRSGRALSVSDALGLRGWFDERRKGAMADLWWVQGMGRAPVQVEASSAGQAVDAFIATLTVPCQRYDVWPVLGGQR